MRFRKVAAAAAVLAVLLLPGTVFAEADASGDAAALSLLGGGYRQVGYCNAASGKGIKNLPLYEFDDITTLTAVDVVALGRPVTMPGLPSDWTFGKMYADTLLFFDQMEFLDYTSSIGYRFFVDGVRVLSTSSVSKSNMVTYWMFARDVDAPNGLRLYVTTVTATGEYSWSYCGLADRLSLFVITPLGDNSGSVTVDTTGLQDAVTVAACVLVVCLGFLAGLEMSKICNWWKW